MPFGEEISTTERTVALGYQSDDVRHNFTSYERDAETDLDFAQARMHNFNLGRFSTPDNFTNDTHVYDPQSWNLYVYVRNNPLNFVDPLGEHATVRTIHDQETNTTTIYISASFAVYGAGGQSVSQADLNKHASYLEQGILKAFNTSFEHNGVNYVVHTDISVGVFDSEESAIASGAGNLIELGILL